MPPLDTPQPALGAVAVRPRSAIARRAADLALRYAMLLVLVALAVVANVLSPGFFEVGNLRNILTQNAPVGLVAVGMTFVIIAGGFDLSVSAIVAAASVLFASFAGHVSVPVALLGALAAGIAAGAINGLIVTRLRVNPFVATLGTASIFSGYAYLYSDSQPIQQDRPGFDFLGSGSVAGVPASILVLVAIFLAGGLVLAKTVYGRSVYTIGGNAEAARLSGLRVDVVRGSTYLMTGACAALAGMIMASQTGVGQADIGATITLDAIAIVIIGGTSLLGGEGAMWRTAVGLLLLATINNLFDSLAFDTAAQSVVKGAVVIAAVALDVYTRSRRR